jgi:aromatic ring-cleaving dioxygenase
MNEAPYHAHIYFDESDRDAAASLREQLRALPEIQFVGRMMATGVGPHPIPQFEVHFGESGRDTVIAMIKPSGLRALVHPLTQDDLADHTSLAYWIGEPVELDVSVLDPAGRNKGVPRFGVSDF